MIRALTALLLMSALSSAGTDTLEPLKRAVADDTARMASGDMRFRIRGRKLAIAPFRNDPEGIVAAAFKERIESEGHFTIVTSSTIRDIWDKIVGNDKDAPLTAEKAIEFGKKLDAECVMFGRVETLSIDEGQTVCDVKIRIVDVATGDGVFIGRYRKDLHKEFLSIPHFRVWIYDTSVFQRILIWTVLVLILPFLTLLARDALASAAPIIPIGIVLLLTILDMFLAFLMMGFEAGSILRWGLLVGALAISIFYNLTILAKVAQLQLPGKA